MDESDLNNVFLLKKMRETRANLPKQKRPDALNVIMEECIFILGSNLEECLRESSTTLFQFAKNAVKQSLQDEYFAAIQCLDNHQDAIKESFCDELGSQFSQLKMNEAKAFKSKENSTDNLALINNQEMDLIVAKETSSKRWQNAFKASLEALVQRFDHLTYGDVTILNLPLGPTVLCETLFKTMNTHKIEGQAQLIILKVFEENFLNKLGNLYALCNHALIKQGVLPNLSTTGSSSNARANSIKVKGQEDTRQKLNIDTKREFAADSLAAVTQQQASEQPVNATANNPAMEGAIPKTAIQSTAAPTNGFANQETSLFFDQLTQMVTQQGDKGSSLSGLAKAIASTINLNSQNQKRALNSVNLSQQLVNKVGQLLTHSPLDKTSIQQLAIPIAQLACQDPGFLNKREHDAKQLLNQLFDAALKVDGSSPDAVRRDPLLHKCHELINRIQKAKSPSQEFFKQLLIEFNQYLALDEKRSKIIERRTLGAEQGKIISEETEKFVEQTLVEIMGGLKLAAPVTHFIKDGWKPVLIYNGLRWGISTKKWEAKLQVLLDVVSSTQPFSSTEEMDRAKIEFPNLIQSIRENFNEIALDHFKQEELIQGIDGCFVENISQGKHSNSAPIKKLNINELFSEVDALLQESITAEKRKVAEVFIDQAKNFGRGSWFEIQDSEQIVRGRLAAIVGKQEKYIFVNRQGKKIKDLSLSNLALALQEQKIKPLDSNQMFDIALSAVIKSSKMRTQNQSAV